MKKQFGVKIECPWSENNGSQSARLIYNNFFMYKGNLSVNSDFSELKFQCSFDEEWPLFKEGIYGKVYFRMEVLCRGIGFVNPHGLSPGMKDVGCGCDDDFERSRISCPLWKRGLLIETSLRRELSSANTPLMQLNGNIRNCYDFLSSKQYVFSQ